MKQVRPANAARAGQLRSPAGAQLKRAIPASQRSGCRPRGSPHRRHHHGARESSIIDDGDSDDGKQTRGRDQRRLAYPRPDAAAPAAASGRRPTGPIPAPSGEDGPEPVDLGLQGESQAVVQRPPRRSRKAAAPGAPAPAGARGTGTQAPSRAPSATRAARLPALGWGGKRGDVCQLSLGFSRLEYRCRPSVRPHWTFDRRTRRPFRNHQQRCPMSAAMAARAMPGPRWSAPRTWFLTAART